MTISVDNLDKLLRSLTTTREVPANVAGTKIVTTVGDLHAVLRAMPRAISARRGRGKTGSNQYDDTFKQQVLDAIPFHNSLEACARHFGINVRTIHRWKQHNPQRKE